MFTTLSILTLTVYGQKMERNDSLIMVEEKLPDWVIIKFKKLKLDSLYKISYFINPFYLEADFNGDNKQDIAIAIEQTKTKKKGIIIFHNLTDKFFILGAGTSLDDHDDDFQWMDVWKVYSDKTIANYEKYFNDNPTHKTETIELKTKAIYVAKYMSFSAVIYWNGHGYEWVQQGD